MLWIAILLACNRQVPEAPKPTKIELPPFEDPGIERIYHRIVAWSDRLGWTATPLRRGGSFLERTWVRGEPGKGMIAAPGTARVALSVLAYSEPTSSYGLEWSAGITDELGLGVYLDVASGARGFMPDHVRIDLQRNDQAPAEFGAPLSWEIGVGGVETAEPAGLAEVQAKLATYQGPSFAAEADRDLRSLEAVVRPVLERGDYTMCNYGPSPGGGIPGPCNPRAPTEAERAAHRAAFDAEMARRRDVLGDGTEWLTLLKPIMPPL